MAAPPKVKTITVDFVPERNQHAMYANDFELSFESEHLISDFIFDDANRLDATVISICISVKDLANQRQSFLDFLRRTDQFEGKPRVHRARKLAAQPILPVNLMQFAHEDLVGEMNFYALSMFQALEVSRKTGADLRIKAYPVLMVRCSVVLMRAWIEEAYLLYNERETKTN